MTFKAMSLQNRFDLLKEERLIGSLCADILRDTCIADEHRDAHCKHAWHDVAEMFLQFVHEDSVAPDRTGWIGSCSLSSIMTRLYTFLLYKISQTGVTMQPRRSAVVIEYDGRRCRRQTAE
jgi:hypothetical protein